MLPTSSPPCSFFILTPSLECFVFIILTRREEALPWDASVFICSHYAYTWEIIDLALTLQSTGMKSKYWGKGHEYNFHIWLRRHSSEFLIWSTTGTHLVRCWSAIRITLLPAVDRRCISGPIPRDEFNIYTFYLFWKIITQLNTPQLGTEIP